MSRFTVKGTGIIDCGGTIASLGKQEYSRRYSEQVVKSHIKLGELEDIEQELDIDLVELFSKQYEGSCFLHIEKDDKTIYFCGDSYYGHWTQKQWLNFIKEVIAVYRELLRLGH